VEEDRSKKRTRARGTRGRSRTALRVAVVVLRCLTARQLPLPMSSNDLERDLTKSAVGFMSKDDYKRKREELEDEEALAAMRRAITDEGGGDKGEKDKKKKKKDKKRPAGALSFGDELEEEGEVSPSIGNKKMGKCQDVDTAGLKKNEREEQAAALKQEQAMRDYLLEQRRVREEPLTLNYSFRSAVTQRELPNAVAKASVTVKRGNTAEEIARAVHRDTEKLGEKFHPKSISGIREETDCMFVLNATVPENTASVTQGSFLIPPTMSLIDLAAVKWVEGAPLFDLQNVIVIERRWYEQMRHTYPYSQWKFFEARLLYSQKEFVSNRNSGTGIDPIAVNRPAGRR